MLDFYTSTEFRAYRKKVIKELVDFVKPRMLGKDPNEFWQASGAIEFARKLFEIPIKEENSQRVAICYQEDLNSFFATLIRASFEE